MGEIRIGLIGCGIISEDHARAYLQHRERCRIVVCCDADMGRAEARAAQVGGAHTTTSVSDVLEDPEVDAIDLCTPPHLHPDVVIAAARAGKHISCQKPLARTIAECDSMIDAAREARVTLYHAEFNRTLPASVRAKQLVAAGRIGVPVGVQATFAFWQGGKMLTSAWRYDPALAGGGQLLDSGIHAVDLIRNIGGEVQSVACSATNFRPELGGEDTACVGFRYRAGHLGTLFSTQACGIWSPTANFVVFGTEGVLTMGGAHGALAIHRANLPNRIEVIVQERGDIFESMIDAFLRTVERESPNPSPGEEGRENLRFVLGAYESVRLGRHVELARYPEAREAVSGG